MPVTMSVTPELARVGEDVVLKMEVLATQQPNSTVVLHPDFLVRGIDSGRNSHSHGKSSATATG